MKKRMNRSIFIKDARFLYCRNPCMKQFCFGLRKDFLSHNHNMQSRKQQNDFQNYEFYLNCAEQIGIKVIRKQTEK